MICVGAANSLANPKRLLRSMPSALYEIGTAMVVAVTVLPQLADSARRVRAAQRLRGGEAGRVRRLRRLLVPVLEDALERSLALAAGMDTRGYGRTTGLTPGRRRLTGRADADGPVRHVCRRLRRPRPDRTPDPGPADAGSGVLAALSGCWAPAAGCGPAATGPTRGVAAEWVVLAAGISTATSAGGGPPATSPSPTPLWPSLAAARRGASGCGRGRARRRPAAPPPAVHAEPAAAASCRWERRDRAARASA